MRVPGSRAVGRRVASSPLARGPVGPGAPASKSGAGATNKHLDFCGFANYRLVPVVGTMCFDDVRVLGSPDLTTICTYSTPDVQYRLFGAGGTCTVWYVPVPG